VPPLLLLLLLLELQPPLELELLLELELELEPPSQAYPMNARPTETKLATKKRITEL
jgi:hypothetical protein